MSIKTQRIASNIIKELSYILAYEVKKQNQGYYYVINFELKSEDIYELERIYRITDEILKFIVVRKES